jgi:hypothetical protein
MENMEFFLEMIHMLYMKLKYFHYCWGYMWWLGVDPYWIEIPDASRVPVGVPPMAEREKQEMTVSVWEEINKTSLHMVVDIDLHHK